MRDKKRIKPILEELERIWNMYPDKRFGQLISNVIGKIAHKNEISDIFFPEDDAWLKYLKDYQKDMGSKGGGNNE